MFHDHSTAMVSTYNVADSKEWALLLNVPSHVAAMVALADDTLIALDFRAKCLLTTDKKKGHCSGMLGGGGGG